MFPKKQAHFIENPRAYTDLLTPHLVQDEETYTVKARVRLGTIDYDNFVSDMLVDRDYIEKASSMCAPDNDTLECILISKKGSSEGVLVVPRESGYVHLAAFSSAA